MGNSFDSEVSLTHFDSISAELFQPFVDVFSDAGVQVSVERRPQPGPFACLEWYVPTAAILFLAKSYFDGFLKEAGKDHYAAVKKGLAALWPVFFGDKRAVQMKVIASGAKKLTSGGAYSLGLSVMAELGEHKCFKLLLSETSSRQELESAVGTFLEFVERYHSGALDPLHMERLKAITRKGSIFAVTYDREAQEIVVLESIPKPQSDGDA